ncbi:hypothetical protein [Algoriphagus marincola]|uniref:hypothetical protein n=1 Tax=Algoriphagus marincola TaxID=264027 RepID=UPI0004133FEB|nr:hypothetical protein [Algoriphagus marincola]
MFDLSWSPDSYQSERITESEPFFIGHIKLLNSFDSLPSQKILPLSFFTDQDLIQTFGFLIPVALPMVYEFARGGRKQPIEAQ